MLAPQVIHERSDVAAQHVEATKFGAEDACETALFAVRLHDEAVFDAEDAVEGFAAEVSGLTTVVDDDFPDFAGAHG